MWVNEPADHSGPQAPARFSPVESPDKKQRKSIPVCALFDSSPTEYHEHSGKLKVFWFLAIVIETEANQEVKRAERWERKTERMNFISTLPSFELPSLNLAWSNIHLILGIPVTWTKILIFASVILNLCFFPLQLNNMSIATFKYHAAKKKKKTK